MDYLPFVAAHDAPVAVLLDLCFGPARHLRTAALLRHGAERVSSASFVAMSGTELAGAVQCFALEWRRPDGLTRDLVLLGPLVSHPAHRGKGVGLALMQRATGQLDAMGQSAMLIGDEPYYGRFGFSAAATARLRLPGPVDRARLLLRSTTPALFDADAEIGPPMRCATRAA